VLKVVELLLSFRLGLVGGVGVADGTAEHTMSVSPRRLLSRISNTRFEACSNVCRVLGVAAGLSLRVFELVELLLGLPFGFVGGVGVVDRTEQKYHVNTHFVRQRLKMSNVRFQACSNVCRVLVLLFRDLGLVVEALVAQSLELFARVLFAFGGGVGVAEGTGTES
jgi:hypothetical protein